MLSGIFRSICQGSLAPFSSLLQLFNESAVNMSATTTHTQVTHFRRINTSYSKCMTNKLTHTHTKTNSTKNGRSPASCRTRNQTHSTCPTSGLGRCGAHKSWPPARHDAAVVDGRQPQCRLHGTRPPGSPSGDQEGGTLCQTPAHACHMSAKSIHFPMLTLCFLFISSGLLSTRHYILIVTDELLG